MKEKRNDFEKTFSSDAAQTKGIRSVKIAFAILPVLLAGCIHWPDITTDCESYGVMENRQPMGSVVQVEELYANELEIRCASIKYAVARINPYGRIAGCVIPRADGTVSAYYSVGDRCARNHELCHFMHGTRHMDRYIEKVKNNHPRPYCPENQLKFAALNP